MKKLGYVLVLAAWAMGGAFVGKYLSHTTYYKQESNVVQIVDARIISVSDGKIDDLRLHVLMNGQFHEFSVPVTPLNIMAFLRFQPGQYYHAIYHGWHIENNGPIIRNARGGMLSRYIMDKMVLLQEV